MSLWNVSSASGSLIVAIGRHGHFVWLVFDTDQKFFDFKISFFVESVSSSSRLLIVSRVAHVLNGDSPFIQNKRYWFWNQIFLSNVSMLQGHLLWLEVGMVTLSGYSVNTDQRFFDLKSTFSLNFCQVHQSCLLFLELDVIYGYWPFDFEINYFFWICLEKRT